MAYPSYIIYIIGYITLLYIIYIYTHRIHGAGIYANIKGVYIDGIHVAIYSSTMDPMGYIYIEFTYPSISYNNPL